MIHIIVFSIIALTIFIITFIRLIKENNANYLFALIPEFIGLCIDFIYIFIGKSPNATIFILMYIFSIFIPIISIILKKKGINILEVINLAKSNYFENKGYKEEAKKMLLKNIKNYPNGYLSHKTLAKWYEENNEIEKAEDIYVKIINIKSGNINDYIKLASLYQKTDKKEQAINILQDVLKKQPENLEASLLIGDILYECEMFKEAINIYKQAIKYNPGEYQIYYSLGMTYTRLNDFQNAMEYYKKAATINSILDVAKLNLGQISLIFKEYTEAEKYFMKCIETDDEKIQAEAYYYLAKIKIINGEKELAVQYANIAIEINPAIIKNMEKDVYFTVIIAKLRTKEERKITTKLNEKESNLIKYLNKTYIVVEKLTQEDIKDNEKVNEQDRELG